MSSADFCKLSVQKVADLLIIENKQYATCEGTVDGEKYRLIIELQKIKE